MSEENSTQSETFEAFYKSFSYGSRSDLSFKFIAGLPEEVASRFFTDLFRNIIDGLDFKDTEPIKETVLNWQIKSYDKPSQFAYDSGPFHKPDKPLTDATIGLISSSGHFAAGNDPEPFGIANMTQQEAVRRIGDFIKQKPELSEIPVEIPSENLMVRHGGYDIRAAQRDVNTVFPYQILRRMAESKRFGKLASMAYSFVGACSQLKLQKESIPGWIERFKSAAIDALVMVPV